VLEAGLAAAMGALLGTVILPGARRDTSPPPTPAGPPICDGWGPPGMRTGAARAPGAPTLLAATLPAAAAEVPDHEALDPASPHYDPRRARPMLKPVEIYLQEPRDPTWAPPVEKWLGDHLAADLARMVPDARDVAVDCRTRTCLIEWTGTPEADRQVKALYLALYAAAETDFIGPGRILAILGGSRGPFADVPAGDQTAFIKRMDYLRQAFIWQLDRKPHRVKAFPRELWPKE
jgi:hypothetical protein